MSARTTPRRPAYAGAIGLAITALLIFAAMNAGRLPVIGHGGREVRADFVDASGIEKGDRVEVAGVRVGEVRGLAMGRGHIEVRFTVADGIKLGSRTTARIKVGNLLGSKYLQVIPAGGGTLTGTIPVSRTRPAYDVTAALGDFTETTAPIDTKQLETALSSITTTFRGAAPDVRASVRGLSTIARTIADRDADVSALLSRSEKLTASLDSSRGDIAGLVRDAGLLLAELDRRREAIHGLIVHTDALAVQLHGLVRDNQATLAPALAALGQVTAQLERRQHDVEATLHAVAKFARVFVDTIGSGPWFDSYIANLPDSVTKDAP
ncbi:MCE family protein [Nocardioides marmorisolisilvae]|uniref:MCE family protein n=1 Tax=Nocardioides marmorisolisilvae TaxID=1542737 RepID=A0A3N0DRZ1_9ACTN|nr:MlaD family protein [Nocardioides marmorisolisilvae]RNL78395.1 MCE family protein [Nocardioides marmorisolisilvae]